MKKKVKKQKSKVLKVVRQGCVEKNMCLKKIRILSKNLISILHSPIYEPSDIVVSFTNHTTGLRSETLRAGSQEACDGLSRVI